MTKLQIAQLILCFTILEGSVEETTGAINNFGNVWEGK